MLSVDLVSTPRLYKHMILKDYLIHLTAFLESKKPFIFVQDTIKYRSDKSNMSSMQMMNYPNFKLAFENYSTLGYMASFLIIEHDLIDPTPIVMDQLICLIPLKELAFIQEYQGEVKDIVFCQQNIIKALEIMVLRAQLVSEINKEEYKYTTPLLERFVEKYASDYLDYSSSADDYITGYGFMILKWTFEFYSPLHQKSIVMSADELRFEHVSDIESDLGIEVKHISNQLIKFSFPTYMVNWIRNFKVLGTSSKSSKFDSYGCSLEVTSMKDIEDIFQDDQHLLVVTSEVTKIQVKIDTQKETALDLWHNLSSILDTDVLCSILVVYFQDHRLENINAFAEATR